MMHETEQQIEPTADARPEISDRLERIMKRKQVFSPETHTYLTEVMLSFVDWEESHFTPSVYTRTTDPFIFQMQDAQEEFALDASLLSRRLEGIGSTALCAVGFWPESVSSIMAGDKVIRERPDLEYYASVGATAYKRAANARLRKRIFDTKAEIMQEMARGFRQYAGVLYIFREESGGPHTRDIELLFKIHEFLRDEEVMNRYLIKQHIIRQ